MVPRHALRTGHVDAVPDRALHRTAGIYLVLLRQRRRGDIHQPADPPGRMHRAREGLLPRKLGICAWSGQRGRVVLRGGIGDGFFPQLRHAVQHDDLIVYLDYDDDEYKFFYKYLGFNKSYYINEFQHKF